MTLRGLPIVACLLIAFGTCATVHAWTAGGGEGGATGVGGVEPTHNGGVGIGGTVGGAGNGVAGGNGKAGGDPSDATSLQGTARPYSLRAIYFRRGQFKTIAECQTAAHNQRLPLEVCQ